MVIYGVIDCRLIEKRPNFVGSQLFASGRVSSSEFKLKILAENSNKLQFALYLFPEILVLPDYPSCTFNRKGVYCNYFYFTF